MSLLKVHHADIGFFVGEVLTIRKLGDEYSVYLKRDPMYSYWNCYQNGYSDHDVARLAAFDVGEQYRVERMDRQHMWLADVTYPDCVKVPDGL